MRYIFFLWIMLSCPTLLLAQKILHGHTYAFRTGLLAASKQSTPFFLHTNQFGLMPTQPGIAYLSAGISKDYDSLLTLKRKLKPFNYGYGINVHANMGKTNQILLPEAYLKLRFKHLEFYGGRRKEIQGLTDSTLSSGAYVWSGNALPVPKLQISTPNWVGWGPYKRLSYKAGLSHGWFGTQGIIENYYLHQKWLYLKISDKKQKLQLMGGINHQTQWGGYSEELKKVGGPFPPTLNGYLAPNPLYSYQFILLPFLQKLIGIDPTKVPGFDGGLAIGNQLGSIDLSAIINQNWQFYHQKPFDFARSLVNFNNIEDGIYGIAWKSKQPKTILQHVVGEFIYTKSQGLYRFGKYRMSNSGEYDDYFSHGQYQSWTYKNRIMGTPFILTDDTRRVVNNRVKAFYIAIDGQYNSLNFMIKALHSSNYGRYSSPVDVASSSFLLAVQYPLPYQLNLSLQISQDIGGLFKNATGFHISFTKSLIL
ncbi:capsule assembly Wzi family protein [Lacihabitans sp. CS3-21]|uniref:capsule assembly Wzi family protein n=1 Tax=Lacihabitans sp. CS3-21 TaxID=2487332 RepID=UPI0020CFBAAD|nr:capsule assembly Wzi family protein [Lacihabitans sp. CS3-21]MCP9747547.1 hypothetical protein [Lacihabitans sp. CS3-21]